MLCNAAISIASIEGGKLACAHTQNITFFKMLGFHRSGHKWCIYLRHLSSSAYDALRESGCVALPSQRTLRDFTHSVKATVGFSAAVDQQLMERAHMQTCPEREKYVALILDEMHIKEELVYCKETGK